MSLKKLLFFLSILTPLLFTFSSYALPIEVITIVGQPVEDPIEYITIVGARYRLGSGSNWTVGCRSSDCKASATELTEQLAELFKKGAEEYVEIGEAKQKFCDSFKGKAPEDCGQFSFLSNRGEYFRQLPFTWNQFPAATNGCGSGDLWGLEDYLIGQVISKFAGYTDNIDEPLAGYSFLGACNNHDLCYGAQSGQQSCDNAFYKELKKVCGSNGRCQSAAHGYRTAVGLKGEGAYSYAGKAKACKAYKDDVTSNCGSD